MQPFKDFILGTREIAFKSLEEFAKYVEVNQNQEIRLHLYSIETEKVREVALTPNKEWGGQGLLGCDVSFGYFNKLPLREKDQQRLKERNGMLGILGKLTGDTSVSPSLNATTQKQNPSSVDQFKTPPTSHFNHNTTEGEEEAAEAAEFVIEDIPIKEGEVIDDSTVLQAKIVGGGGGRNTSLPSSSHP